MSGKRARRQFLAERKAEVVRRHLSGKEAAFAKTPAKARRVEDAKDRKTAELEAQVAKRESGAVTG